MTTAPPTGTHTAPADPDTPPADPDTPPAGTHTAPADPDTASAGPDSPPAGRFSRRRLGAPRRSQVDLAICMVLVALCGLLVGRYLATPAAPAALPTSLGTIPAANPAANPAAGADPAAGTDPAAAGPGANPATAPAPGAEGADPALPPPPAALEPVEAPAAATMPASTPTAIKIADLKISSTLGQVGLNKDGTVEVPTNYAQAAWYRYGPTPGALGPAVILGHVDSRNGPAVFYNLTSMKPGQVIEVTRADNTTARFRVDAIKTFLKSEFPTEAVYGPIDYAGLRLITCGGIYDQKAKDYQSNVIAFATLIT